ncbi:tetratricopeptide repeat protein [Motiliproteus sp. SC1-56]|uniref:tetratricopeptide repeat protein n=1 Tax=Motiliproteus sp. SC1-56 TaxID=2799565 RepID=UPI001A8D52DD|nr:tetratricopeptide repeat protein [Motiliproteus sp. SC1-56]
MAQLYLLHQRPESALEHAEHALNQPGYAGLEAYLLAANAQLQLNRPDQALQHFTKALEQAPKHPAALLGQARGLLRQGDLEGARSAVDQALTHAPDSDSGLFLSALIHLSNGEAKKAKTILVTLSQRVKDPDLNYLLGYAQLVLGEKDSAQRRLAESLTEHPDHRGTRLVLSSLYASSGELSLAESTLAPLLNDQGASADALGLAGNLSLRQGRAHEAARYFSAAMADNAKAPLDGPLALAELLSGDTKKGIARLQALTRETPSPATSGLLISSYLSSGQAEKARALADELITAHPEQVEYHLLAAQVAYRTADIGKAKRYLEGLLRQNPKAIAAMLAMGNLAVEEKQFENAHQWYEKARNSAPDDHRPMQAQVRLYLHQEQAAKASELANAFYQSHPEQLIAVQTYLATLLAQNRQQDALELLKKETGGRHADNPALLLRRVELTLASDARKRARSLAVELTLAHPDYLPGQLLKANLMIEDGEATHALDLLESLSPTKGGLRLAHLELKARALAVLNRPQEAGELYANLYAQLPKPQIAVQMTRLFRQAGQPEVPLEILTSRLQEAPDDPAARTLVAELFFQKGDTANALKHYQQLTEQQPGHLVAWNNLAWLYHQARDPRAVEAAEAVTGWHRRILTSPIRWDGSCSRVIRNEPLSS